MNPLRIHILGASGAGTTTLAEALQPRLGATVLDADDYYWVPTRPPFRERRDREERRRLLLAAFTQHPRAIVPGALLGWGEDLEHAFDLVVFLLIPQALRVERLRRRELARYGLVNEEFIAWAAGYDDEPPSSATRNRSAQEAWLAARRCPVLRLEGDLTVAERVEAVLAQLPPGRRGCAAGLGSEFRP